MGTLNVKVFDEMTAALADVVDYGRSGGMGRNVYTIPAFKAAMIALSHATGQPTSGTQWMDVTTGGVKRPTPREPKE